MCCLMVIILGNTVQRLLSKLGAAVPYNSLYLLMVPTITENYLSPATSAIRAYGVRQSHTARNPSLIPGIGLSSSSKNMSRLIRQNKWERYDSSIKACRACGHDHEAVRFARCVFPRGISGGRYDTFVGVCPSTGRDIQLADYIGNGNSAPTEQ